MPRQRRASGGEQEAELQHLLRSQHVSFQRLLANNADISAGLYVMEGGKAFATVPRWDEDHFERHGHFRFITVQDISGKEELIEVDYTGMGFMLVKRGVFERLEYPWLG